MDMSSSQVRLAPMSGFAALDYATSPQIETFLGGGGGTSAPVLQTFGAIEQPASQASQGVDADIDANVNPQDVNEDELLDPVALDEVAVSGNALPWLRRASLYKAVNYRGPYWLTGQENWVYLVVVALVAGGAWWYFKRK